MKGQVDLKYIAWNGAVLFCLRTGLLFNHDTCFSPNRYVLCM